MKVYVGSKFDRAADVRVVQDVLVKHGHEIIGDWTKHSCAGLFGGALRDTLRKFAFADVRGVENSDAFVMLHDSGSRGGFTELGIALGLGKIVAVLNGRTAIPHRAPIFYALPEVEHFDDPEALAKWFTYLDTAFAAKTHAEVLQESV